MRTSGLFALLLPLSLAAQLFDPALTPTINPDGIVRADSTLPGILSPGIVFSVWGHGYGPHDGCKGPALEVCGVQVLLDGVPIEVQYTNDVLINARMPESASPRPTSQLVVVSGGLRSKPTDVRRRPQIAVIAPDGVARVNGPVWIHVELPELQKTLYPSMIQPWDFGCDEFEVRRNGKVLTPISHPTLGGMGTGPFCPWVVGMEGARAENRLPLHLQYAFAEPGIYEVRLSHYSDFARRKGNAVLQSAWTEVTVLPAAARTIASRPPGPAGLLSDFLPNLLARRDDEALGILLEYLYHASPLVRRYVASALYYWPDAVIDARLLETVRANGPSPEIAQRLSAHISEAMEAAMPFFGSDNIVFFQGALATARVALAPSSGIDSLLRLQVEQRLIGAATDIAERWGAQTTNDVITLISQIHDSRAHDLLWNFAEHHLGLEQALICITWQKDPQDLERLTNIVLAQPSDDKSGSLSGVAYAMHNQYGEAALPWLRAILEKSQVKFLRTASAGELMRGNDKAGFAFALDAVATNRAWKAEMRRIVVDQFPETRNDTDAQMAAFLSTRVN